MTAFADALDLRTAVIDYAKAPRLAEVWPRLVKQVEAEFNRKLRVNTLIKSANLTFFNGTTAWPADMVEIIGIYDPNGFEYVQQSLQAAKPNGYWYAINGGTIETTLMAGTLRCDYYKRIASISDDLDAVNDVLNDWPNLYLYALLVEAGRYLRDMDLMALYAPLLAAEYRAVKVDDDRMRYSRARIRVGGPTP
jgi:hypothetical protein